jgi:hypothetical protein
LQGIALESFVREIAFESFGVRIGVRASDARVWERLAELLPPHSRPCGADAIEHRFSVTRARHDSHSFTVRYDIRDGVPARLIESASWVCDEVDLSLALGLLGDHVHETVAYRAPERIFIHAGAVGYRDRAVIMPGEALTGKSSLVAALVRAGAAYYSDRFAVLDDRGRVHPYRTQLHFPGSDRAPAGDHGDQGLLVGEEPLRVGAIVMTSYRPGAEWRPRGLSQGESVLALMSQTVPAEDRPEDSMRVIRRVLDADPLVIESDRDEADALASSLLRELDHHVTAPGRSEA